MTVSVAQPLPAVQPLPKGGANRPVVDLAIAEQMRADGATYQQIARVFGVSTPAVRQALIRARSARDAGHEIPPPAAITVLDVELQLRGALAETLIREARNRGVKPVDLLAQTIELVVADNLFKAVLG